MDDQTMQVGLLLEAAQANRKTADASLKRLRTATRDLADVVREEVQRVIALELGSLASDAQRAAQALRLMQRSAGRRTLVWSVGVTALCSLIPLGLAAWMLPSGQEMASLRARHDELTFKIARLEAKGGRIDLRSCGAGARLCVRVDRKAPSYGEQSDYLVVRGY